MIKSKYLAKDGRLYDKAVPNSIVVQILPELITLITRFIGRDKRVPKRIMIGEDVLSLMIKVVGDDIVAGYYSDLINDWLVYMKGSSIKKATNNLYKALEDNNYLA